MQKSVEEILQKLGIEALNKMQSETFPHIASGKDTIILSPTGSGKTLAFLLPLISNLDKNQLGIQLLIITPTRELALQIDQVIRNMGSGFKVNAVYGGRAGSNDRAELQTMPSILVGTPGRIVDHLKNELIHFSELKAVVLDEFDKSVEIGYKTEMEEIMNSISEEKQRILTSATDKSKTPSYLKLNKPKRFTFEKEESNQLIVKEVEGNNKLRTLANLLSTIGENNGIIFCNFKNSIETVSDYLFDEGVEHVCFFGGMDQKERERSLIKFRNGSSNILLATDLAARGLDIPDLGYIIHYEIPQRPDEYIHRNGRTARMKKDGVAYILTTNQPLPPYIKPQEKFELKKTSYLPNSKWATLYITGGRKDKISKGDIAGLFFKTGGLDKYELGLIELKRESAFIAVPKEKAENIASKLNNSKLKKKKVRISILN